MLREDSIVDAAIISASSSTKNESDKRDPEMRQTKKGNQWHFDMKIHIGVYDTFGLIRNIDITPLTPTISRTQVICCAVTSNECSLMLVILGFKRGWHTG